MMRRRFVGISAVVTALAFMGCGGDARRMATVQAAAPAPAAKPAAPPPPPPPATAAAPGSPEEQAQKKFADLSKDIEKFGKGEPVDRAWLEGELNAVLKIDPKFAPARFNLAVLTERDGDRAAARQAYAQIARENPRFAPAQENLASYDVTDGKRDEAIATYRRIIQSEPKDVTSRLALARLLAEQKQYTEAIALARQALQHQADAIEAFRVLAECYEALDNTPMAELIIGRGLKVNKDDTELHYLTAKILLDRGELAAGVNKLKEIVTLDPKWLKDYGNAAQQFDAVLKEDPKNRAARIGLAVSYKGIGRFEQAEKLYVDLLTQDPKDASALWDLAVLYHHQLNRYDDAIANYKKYKAIAPANDEKAAEVDKLVADLEKQKNDLAAIKAHEEHEAKKLEATQAACAATHDGKKPNAEAIGNDKERIEVAWQKMVDAQTAIQGGDVAGGEAMVACAFAITPDTAGAKVEACAPMHVMWTQILYQLGRSEDALAVTREALKCDPNNPDAQLIEQQLKEILGQKGGDTGAAQPGAAPAETKPAKAPGKKRKGK